MFFLFSEENVPYGGVSIVNIVQEYILPILTLKLRHKSKRSAAGAFARSGWLEKKASFHRL